MWLVTLLAPSVVSLVERFCIIRNYGKISYCIKKLLKSNFKKLNFKSFLLFAHNNFYTKIFFGIRKVYITFVFF